MTNMVHQFFCIKAYFDFKLLILFWILFFHSHFVLFFVGIAVFASVFYALMVGIFSLLFDSLFIPLFTDPFFRVLFVTVQYLFIYHYCFRKCVNNPILSRSNTATKNQDTQAHHIQVHCQPLEMNQSREGAYQRASSFLDT